MMLMDKVGFHEDRALNFAQIALMLLLTRKALTRGRTDHFPAGVTYLLCFPFSYACPPNFRNCFFQFHSHFHLIKNVSWYNLKL